MANSSTIRVLTTRKGRTVRTHLTDAEAMRCLEQQVEAGTASDFGRNLVQQAAKYGLTEEQFIWVHILALPPEPNIGDGHEFPEIVALFDTAASGLRTPKITFVVGDLEGTQGDQQVQLSRAGSRSKYFGDVQLTDGGSYGANQYFGRIERNTSTLHATDSMTQDVFDALCEMEENPAEFASSCGARSGNCCFCNRRLTTRESLTVGYGPVCAENFGLPWGSHVTTEEMTG